MHPLFELFSVSPFAVRNFGKRYKKQDCVTSNDFIPKGKDKKKKKLICTLKESVSHLCDSKITGALGNPLRLQRVSALITRGNPLWLQDSDLDHVCEREKNKGGGILKVFWGLWVHLGNRDVQARGRITITALQLYICFHTPVKLKFMSTSVQTDIICICREDFEFDEIKLLLFWHVWFQWIISSEKHFFFFF